MPTRRQPPGPCMLSPMRREQHVQSPPREPPRADPSSFPLPKPSIAVPGRLHDAFCDEARLVHTQLHPRNASIQRRFLGVSEITRILQTDPRFIAPNGPRRAIVDMTKGHAAIGSILPGLRRFQNVLQSHFPKTFLRTANDRFRLQSWGQSGPGTRKCSYGLKWHWGRACLLKPNLLLHRTFKSFN